MPCTNGRAESAQSLVSTASTVNMQGVALSYHIRNVPAFSTIEMSPGCGFTTPVKKIVSASVCKSVAKDDSSVPVRGQWGSGMGARGKGQRPFLRSAL
jgi:hypothetical protein